MLENLDAETGLLGQMLFENSVIDLVADRVTAADFSQEINGRIFDLAVSEYSAGRAANPVTLKGYLDGDEDYKRVGGIQYLAGLTGSVDFTPAGDLAHTIADLARRRRVIEGLSEAQGLCRDLHTSHAEIIARADDALSENGKDSIHQPTGGECFDELIEGFSEKTIGVTCRTIPSLDDVLGPLRPKQLAICAGRPGMGKTAVALSYALGAARAGHGVLFVSLEMSSRELAQRLASDLCFDHESAPPVPFSAIRDGRLSQEQHRLVRDARDYMRELPFQVIDAGGLTTGRLSSLIRRHSRRMAAKGHSLDLVVVDYLQLVRPNHRGSSNYENVSEVSRSLKEIAKDHDVPVLALAQLSREVEKRPDRRPQLSDLRDSGGIEQDADAVMFLMRAEYYLRKEEPPVTHKDRLEWEQAMSEAKNKIEFIVAKRRNGVEGSATGEFHGAYQAVRG